MKMKMKYLVLFLTLVSLLLGLTSYTHATTRAVSLGNMEFTNADSTNSLKIGDGLTIDGKEDSDDNGWGLDTEKLASGEPQHITWTWEAFSAPPLAQGERIGHYTYTINLHNGTDFLNLNWLLKSYSLALGDPPHNSDNFTTITDYQSFSNTQEAQDHDHTMSIDANGLITTTKANITGIADIHTLVFRSTSLSNQIRLVLHDPVEAGWDENFSPKGSFLLREITGSVTANVIPEPSTYALIMGLLALGFAFKRRK